MPHSLAASIKPSPLSARLRLKRMKRSRIPPAAGSLVPTVHQPFGRSLEKLSEAEQGILQMKAAKDRVSYEAGWSKFVDSLEESWSRFYEEGKRTERRFGGWISKYNKTRNEDALLRYLTQARHQSQHAVAGLDWTAPGGLTVGKGFNGIVHSLKVFSDGSYEADARAFPGSPRAHPVTYDYGRPMLPTVVNKRYGQTFPPPRSHLGGGIVDSAPHDAAAIALRYYLDVIGTAKREFVRPAQETP